MDDATIHDHPSKYGAAGDGHGCGCGPGCGCDASAHRVVELVGELTAGDDAPGRIEAKLDEILDELQELNGRLNDYGPLLDEAQRRLDKRNRLLGRNR